MGIVLSCNCKKCGYHFGASVGVGMLYPKVYSETVTAMKEGIDRHVRCPECGSMIAINSVYCWD